MRESGDAGHLGTNRLRLLQVCRLALHRQPNGKRARVPHSVELVVQLEPLILRNIRPMGIAGCEPCDAFARGRAIIEKAVYRA